MQEKAISFAIFLAICLVFVFLFLFVKFLIWLFEKFLNWLCTPADEPQTELTISSTNNRGLNYAPSAPLSDRHIIVQLPPEIEDSNPPAYSNFSPPSYEEAKTICHLCGKLLNDNNSCSSNLHCNSCHIRGHFPYCNFIRIFKEKAAAKHTKPRTFNQSHSSQHKSNIVCHPLLYQL